MGHKGLKGRELSDVIINEFWQFNFPNPNIIKYLPGKAKSTYSIVMYKCDAEPFHSCYWYIIPFTRIQDQVVLMSDVASVMDDKGAVTTLQARPPESAVLGTTPVQTVSDPVHRHRRGTSCILHHHFRLCTFSLQQVLVLIRRCGRSIVDLQAEMVRFIALSIKFSTLFSC